MEQGDFRPMAQNREAMADLVAILDARRADYARAQAELDTSGDTVEESSAKLARVIGALDPAMHPSLGKRVLSMDARAKPGRDGIPRDDVKQRQL